MARGVHTELETQDGQPVVVKRATDPAAQDRLAREAERLTAARHPGVVEVVASPSDDGPLVLAWAGTQTLATARPDVLTATALLADVAATLADLHGRGIVHGRLDPSHVVIDRAGRARLCGFAGPDPTDPEPPPTPADDVAATGRLIEELIGTGSEPEPIPEHRWGRRAWTGFQARAVQTLADQATAPEVERRPTARALADALAELVPDHRPASASPPSTDAGPGPATILGMRIHAEGVDEPDPVRPRTRARSDEEDRRRRRRPPARRPQLTWSPTLRAALVLIGLLGAGLIALALIPAAPATDEAIPTRPRPTSTTTDPTLPPPAEASTTRSPSCPTAASTEGQAVDVDGDGCAEAAIVDAGRITVGATTYQLGAADDDVVLGDWDCDGTATPALLRPSSGEVFVFTRWPDREEPITLTATTTVPTDARLVPAPDGSCGAVAVELADGQVVEVSAAAPEPPR